MEELKKGLIDLYACLSFGINGRQDRKRGDKLLEHFPYVATFIVQTCDPSQNPTIVRLNVNIGIFKKLFIFDFRHSNVLLES